MQPQQDKSYVLIEPLKDTDFVVGVNSPIRAVDLCDDWTIYLPIGEIQNRRKETYRCTSYATLNCVEVILNRLVDLNKIPSDVLNEMDKLGYFNENGDANFSDAFTALMSNTTEYGNTLTAVLDSIRKDGLLPEKDFLSDNYPNISDKQFITQALKDKAKVFLKYFNVRYEWATYNFPLNIVDAKNAVRKSPLSGAIPICNWDNSEVSYCGKVNPEHAIMLYGADSKFKIFDSYEPFQKNLSPTYRIAYALNVYVEFKPDYDKPHFNFSKDLKLGMSNPDVWELQNILRYEKLNEGGWQPTGYFGVKTFKAVVELQKKYNIWQPPTGYVGYYTRKFLNEKYGDTKTIGDNWVRELYEQLVGASKDLVESIKKLFK